MNKAKVILLVFLGFSFLGLGLLGLRVGMLVKEHMDFATIRPDLLETVPVEEVWEATEEGEEVWLGYMSFWLEPNEIESVEIDSMGYHSIELKDGIRLVFAMPKNEKTVEDWQKDPIVRSTREELQTSLNYYERFEGIKNACYVRPMTNLEYIWLEEQEREFYRSFLLLKRNVLNEKGIIIFETEDIQGIFRRGDEDNIRAQAEIFVKESKIQQEIDIVWITGLAEAEQEAKIKRILGSMRYLVEELPGEGELERMVMEAVERIKKK